jgi:hypothetical protein
LYYHKKLAAGGWVNLTLMEQLGNIGSEVGRTIRWFKAKNPERFRISFEKALELFDLTIADSRWRLRLKEITRSREVFCSLLTEPEKYENLEHELNSLDNYFFQFGLAARLQREKKK